MARDHIRLLDDLNDLCEEYLESGALEQLFDKVVTLLARHMRADVCSIYLFEEKSRQLTLNATYGLKVDPRHVIRLAIGEGIAGRAMETKKVVVEKSGSASPHFKAVPGIEEEKYDAYLAVPVLMGDVRIGVLMLQRGSQRYFLERDIMAVRAVSSQLAYLVENTRLHMSLHEGAVPVVPPDLSAPPAQPAQDMRLVTGRIASEGVVYGPSIRLVDQSPREILSELPDHAGGSSGDFEDALDASVKQIEGLQKAMEKEVMDDSLYIFTGHLMILKDRTWLTGVREKISGGLPAAQAVVETAERFAKLFARSESQLVREKVHDLEDITRRLLSNIAGHGKDAKSTRGHIVIARNLYPSELLRVASEKAAGLVLVSGGATSHIAILSRSLRIPLMIVDDPRLLKVADGTNLLLDGDAEKLYFDPEKTVVTQRLKKVAARKESSKNRTGKTADGTEVHLFANVNLISDVKHAKEAKAAGVGLYRSEFAFMFRQNLPSEEEQFELYRRIFTEQGDKPVTLRTLDLGGDKLAQYYPHGAEENPALGLRSVRFTFRHRDLFETQVRAMLRAGEGHDLRMMFPMISSLEELLEAKSVVRGCLSELEDEGIPHHASPQLGMMVEVPAVIPILSDLAAQSDFFSVGTNDLVQYTLGVDRNNERVSEYYLPHHPAVLRILRDIADVATKNRIPVSICGDMAHQFAFLPFFVGIGIRHLSVDTDYIPKIRERLAGISLSEAQTDARELLQLSSVREIAFKLGFAYEPLGKGSAPG